MARALKCDYELDIPELWKVSGEARDLVEALLVGNPEERLTAEECLAHPWLSGDVIYIDVINELETTWMRRCLARRRYHKISLLPELKFVVQQEDKDLIMSAACLAKISNF